MGGEDLRLELSKIRNQQQQWHDDFELKRDEFNQREKHWWWQRGFWLVLGTAATTTAIITGITFLVKM